MGERGVRENGFFEGISILDIDLPTLCVCVYVCVCVCVCVCSRAHTIVLT